MAEVFYANASELARLTNTFAVSGVATDPTTVTLVVTSPSMTATTYTYAASQITKDSTGVYHKDIACIEDGVWQYLWVGTGAASDAQAGTWTVQSTALQRLYCTPAEMKSRLRITDTIDDFEIIAALTAVSRSIDSTCNRRFDRVTETRTYQANGYYLLDIDDLVSLTTLAADNAGDGTFETTWAATDFQLLPYNVNVGPQVQPYNQIQAVGSLTFPQSYCHQLARANRVQITGVWGWPAVPDPVKQAAAILAADLMKLREAPFGVAGFGAFGMVRVRENHRAAMLLAPYILSPVLVA